jgi:hypothetical protein
MSAPNEVELLRIQIAEVTEKSRTRKGRIAELETQLAEATGQLTASETALRDATVGAPLRQLAAVVSPVPTLWVEHFQKHYKLELNDGALAVLDIKGEPVMDGDKPIAFEPDSISKLLTDDDNEQSVVFKHITAVSFASGGGASADRVGTEPTISNPKPKASATTHSQFGLR